MILDSVLIANMQIFDETTKTKIENAQKEFLEKIVGIKEPQKAEAKTEKAKKKEEKKKGNGGGYPDKKKDDGKKSDKKSSKGSDKKGKSSSVKTTVGKPEKTPPQKTTDGKYSTLKDFEIFGYDLNDKYMKDYINNQNQNSTNNERSL